MQHAVLCRLYALCINLRFTHALEPGCTRLPTKRTCICNKELLLQITRCTVTLLKKGPMSSTQAGSPHAQDKLCRALGLPEFGIHDCKQRLGGVEQRVAS